MLYLEDLSMHLTVDGNTVACTISNDNEIAFDYTETRNKDIDIQLALKDYINEYNDIRLTGNAWDSQAVVSVASSDLIEFNKIKGDFSGTTLDTHNSIDCDIKVPLWFTVQYKPNLDISAGAWEPNNTYDYALAFASTSSINDNTVFRAKSVFDSNVVTGHISEFKNSTQGSMKFRYNQIVLGNSIQWANVDRVFSGQIKNNSLWYGDLGSFPAFNLSLWTGGGGTVGSDYYGAQARIAYWTNLCPDTDSSISNAQEAAANHFPYFVYTPTYTPSTYLKYNAVFNDNTCANIPNVENISSFRHVSESNSTDKIIGDALADYNNAMSIIVNGNKYSTTDGIAVTGNSYTDLCEQNGDGSNYGFYDYWNEAYDIGDIYDYWGTTISSWPRTNSIKQYGKNGYQLKTYISVTKHDYPDSDYYPFALAPQFNYKGCNSINTAVVYKADGTTEQLTAAQATDENYVIHHVYAVVITGYNNSANTVSVAIYQNFDMFRQLLFGQYNAQGTFEWPVSDLHNIRNRQRIVTKFSEPFFDFDRSNNMTRDERLDWEKNWKTWYPGVQDPQSLSSIVEFEEDDTYTTFNNISITDAKVMLFNDYMTEQSEYSDALHRREVATNNNTTDAEAESIINRYDSDSRIRVALRYTQPGCIIADTGSAIASLICFNTLGIVPWKEGTTKTNNVITLPNLPINSYNVAVYQNHINEADKYIVTDTSAVSANIRLNIQGSVLDVPFSSINKQNTSNDLRNFSTFINASYANRDINDDANIFVSNSDTYIFVSNSDTYAITGGGCTFSLTSNDNNAWLDTLVVKNGAITSSSFKSGIASTDIISALKLCYNYIDGINIAGAIYGHAGLNIKYNKETAAQDLSAYVRPEDVESDNPDNPNPNPEPDNLYFTGENPALEIKHLEDSEITAGKCILIVILLICPIIGLVCLLKSLAHLFIYITQ